MADRLIEAFRAMRGVPIYSPRCGVFDPLRPIDGLELIAAVQKILGRESPACYRLFRWARVRAEGGSFREFCREAGRPRSSAYYRRAKSLARIAAALKEMAVARGSDAAA